MAFIATRLFDADWTQPKQPISSVIARLVFLIAKCGASPHIPSNTFARCRVRRCAFGAECFEIFNRRDISADRTNKAELHEIPKKPVAFGCPRLNAFENQNWHTAILNPVPLQRNRPLVPAFHGTQNTVLLGLDFEQRSDAGLVLGRFPWAALGSAVREGIAVSRHPGGYKRSFAGGQKDKSMPETECPGCDRCADFNPMQLTVVKAADLLQQIGNQIDGSPEIAVLALDLDKAIARRTKKLSKG